MLCTKNRENSLLKLIKSVESALQIDYKILIVDSSDNKSKNLEDKVCNHLEYFWQPDLNLIQAREFSIIRILKEFNIENSILYFIDDDCEVGTNYFREIKKTFRDKQNVVGVTGFNTHYYLWKSFMKELVFRNKIVKRLQGKIILGGMGIGVYEPIGITKVSWLPGFSMAYAGSIIKNLDFCHELSKFNCIGEDLFMSNRLLKYGDLYVNTFAELKHHPDPVNREKRKFKIRYIQVRVWLYLKNRI